MCYEGEMGGLLLFAAAKWKQLEQESVEEKVERATRSGGASPRFAMRGHLGFAERNFNWRHADEVK